MNLRDYEFGQYLAEREQVRLRKEAGLPFPWTEDSILQSYKFTNVQRHRDRTSQELIRHLYEPNHNKCREDILLNAALCRYFGTYEFAKARGWISWADWPSAKHEVVKLATDRLASGSRVFTGAYVITNGGISRPKQEVVVYHYIDALHAKIPEIVDHVEKYKSWEIAASVMSSVPGFGGTGFMTKETLIDTTYTSFWSVDNWQKNSLPVDWYDWTPVGPGSLRGAARLLDVDMTQALSKKRTLEIILELYRTQETWNELDFHVSPTDIQFGLCEFDKYERVRLGQGKPRSRYKP